MVYKITNQLSAFFLCGGFLLLMISCRKFVEIAPPLTQAETETVFSNEAAAVSAVAGLYSQMELSPLQIANGGVTIYTGLSSDEIFNVSPNADLDPFRTNSIDATNSTGIYSRLWSAAYTKIYQINSIIEGLAGSHILPDAVKKQLTGEMKMVRAFHYFYLVNLFGDIPLIITTDYQTNSSMARTPQSEVYLQIIADLSDAQTLLQPDYPAPNRGRPNKYAATALLSRVYLFQKNWKKAEEEATLVINASPYHLETDLKNVFLNSSPEAIWQLIPASTRINTAEGNTFIPTSPTVRPSYGITSFLLNAFEANDARKQDWLGSSVVNGVTYYYPYKYRIKSDPVGTEYYVMLRLAEQYLIRAEARVEQNNLPESRSDINKIRNRAGLSNTTAVTKADLLLAIEHEKQVELFAEWGHRWFDLKRTNRADVILGAEKAPDWQSTDSLYPIPLQELQKNPFLNQNPGY